MNPIQLQDPRNEKPVNLWVCTSCKQALQTEEYAHKCCQPCACGKPTRNRFEAKCSECWDIEYRERRERELAAAELVEWDGSTMIHSEEVDGYRDGWFDSPEDLAEYCEDHELEVPEFAFLGRKRVSELDLDLAVERMLEDTYDEAELRDTEALKKLKEAVDEFNEKNAVTYFEHEYKKKVRIRDVNQATETTAG